MKNKKAFSKRKSSISFLKYYNVLFDYDFQNHSNRDYTGAALRAQGVLWADIKVMHMDYNAGYMNVNIH